MPTGNGLGVAAGVAQGVDAFTQNFFKARQLKNQEKLQKNMVVVDLLMNQLRDPNTPYYERAKIMDQIPGLIGAKMERPLSHVLGYDKLNESDFQIGEEQVGGTKPKSVTDPTAEEYNSKIPRSGTELGIYNEPLRSDTPIATSITQKGTESTIQPVTTKYGNLSPAQIKLQQDLAAQRYSNANDVEKQAAILRINYKLQSEILGKNGFSKEIFRGYDASGNYVVTLANSQGETKDINLGPAKSEAIKKAEITGAGKGSTGKLGQLIKSQEIVQAYESDPSLVPKPQYDAAKGLLDDFEKTGQVKDAQVTALTQGASGTKPLSPAQITNNQQEDQRTLLTLQSTVDNLEGELEAAKESVSLTEISANEFYNIQIQPIKDRMKEWLDEGGEKEDKEYRDLNNQLRILNTQHETLKARHGAAKTKVTSIEKRYKSAQKRLSGFNPSTGSATSQQNSSVDDDINQYRNMIDAFKNDPKNIGKVEKMSDRQILKILKDAKRIP